jgi:hypothetical protein
MKGLSRLSIAIIFVALLYWITLPPAAVALDSSCGIAGMDAKLSELVYGRTFWQSQLKAIDASIAGLSVVPDAPDSSKDIRNAIEAKMSRLSDQAAEGTTASGSESYDQQKARFARIALLARCRATVADHLR